MTPEEASELRTLRTLNRVMKALLEESDYDRMLDRIMGELLNALGAERGYLVASKKDALEIRAVRNWTQEEISGETGEVSRSIIHDVLRTKQAVLLEDALASPYRGALSVQALQLASVIAAPLPSRDREHPLGVVYLEARSSSHRFDKSDLAILSEALSVSGRVLTEVLSRMELEARIRSMESMLLSELRFPGIVTADPAMLSLLDTVAQVAPSGATILITGESGSGKELIARAIHLNSERAKHTFHTLNCGAFNEAVLESELFGHVKGAFTGAAGDRAGMIEASHGGTLFLDEVGEMPPSLQVKLLRTIQFGEYKPVGSDKTKTADVRFVAATHRDLEKEVAEGRFRQDLWYRLNTITLEIPPLRQRTDDIPLLFKHFLEKIAARRSIETPRPSEELLEVITKYPWPGNVRELENEAERLLALSAGRTSILQPQLLSRRIVEQAGDRGDPRHLMTRVDAEEKAAIVEALAKEGDNRTRAAKRLGISRETLRLKMKRLGI